jgi:phosphotransferase system HPr (HPr) family protein
VIEQQIAIGHRMGLHARAAAKLVQLTRRYESEITLHRNISGTHHEADARSILALLLLAAGHGSIVAVRASGNDEAEAVQCICEYLKG